jgi:hypothetical protein
MRVRALTAVTAVTLALPGCARESYQNADLQLEVEAPLPEGARSVRLCVEGVGTRSLGAAGSRYAMHGLPEDQPAVVTVDVLTAASPDADDAEAHLLARAGPLRLDEASPLAEAPLTFYDDTTGDAPPPFCGGEDSIHHAEDTWLLAVRFAEP